MNNVKKLLRSRLTLLLALLAVFAITLVGLQPSAAVAACPDAARVNYYSDATYTTQVGTCYHACCKLWTCTGQLTDYSIVAYKIACDFQ